MCIITIASRFVDRITGLDDINKPINSINDKTSLDELVSFYEKHGLSPAENKQVSTSNQQNIDEKNK